MIKLENVNLSIPVYTNETRMFKRALISSVTGGLISRDSSELTFIKAINNVNCTIERGDRVALIGHNGSGKTTFLKLISGIYSQTSGKIKRDIKVYPMISKGFLTSPELSGYVAVRTFYLMVKNSKNGFSEYLEKIIEFSGIGDFIYLPIKTYSEGMTSRLLFTILTSFNHECLALDEGFGAGDSSFYHKAEDRMNSFIEGAGTLIFASHSVDLLNRFCKRGLVFDKGSIIFDGSLKNALEVYHAQ